MSWCKNWIGWGYLNLSVMTVRKRGGRDLHVFNLDKQTHNKNFYLIFFITAPFPLLIISVHWVLPDTAPIRQLLYTSHPIYSDGDILPTICLIKIHPVVQSRYIGSWKVSGIKKEGDVRRVVGYFVLPAIRLVEVSPVSEARHVGCGIVPGKKQGKWRDLWEIHTYQQNDWLKPAQSVSLDTLACG